MKYHCVDCDMSVTDLKCGKCGAPLVHDTLHVDGKTVAVAKCPKDCGKIKSPQCCGHDMQPTS